MSTPPGDESEPYHRELSENDNSLTVRLRLGAFTAVFCGDLEGEGEDIVTKAHPDLRATVLKAPHHGSRTSSTPALLAATQPAAVVFSVGENNAFGFPHGAVVERTRATGARLFRTDTDGAVDFATDGRTVLATTRRSRRSWRWTLPTPAPGAPAAALSPAPPQLPRTAADTPGNPSKEARP